MHSKSNLQYIIIIEEINQTVQNRANELNIKLFTFEQLKEIGKSDLKKSIVL
jgi:hypothetical protein